MGSGLEVVLASCNNSSPRRFCMTLQFTGMHHHTKFVTRSWAAQTKLDRRQMGRQNWKTRQFHMPPPLTSLASDGNHHAYSLTSLHTRAVMERGFYFILFLHEKKDTMNQLLNPFIEIPYKQKYTMNQLFTSRHMPPPFWIQCQFVSIVF